MDDGEFWELAFALSGDIADFAGNDVAGRAWAERAIVQAASEITGLTADHARESAVLIDALRRPWDEAPKQAAKALRRYAELAREDEHE